MSSQQLPGGATSIFSGFTRLCKGLAVVLIGGHIVVQILPSTVSYLALIPAKTIPFAWNLITAGYVEQSIHGLVISTIGLLFVGKLLEPIWGSREFLKFIFIVNFLTSVCVFVTAISLYYITTQETYLYLPISGFQGVLSGFLVGIKQIIPDQELSLLKIKAKGATSIFSGFTRLCKGLAVVLIGGHIVVQILPSTVSYLALIPAKFLENLQTNLQWVQSASMWFL